MYKKIDDVANNNSNRIDKRMCLKEIKIKTRIT